MSDRTQLTDAQFQRILKLYPRADQERERAQAFYSLGRDSDVMHCKTKDLQRGKLDAS